MHTFEQQILSALEDAQILEARQARELLSIPTDSSNGNFTLPCFVLARVLKKAPKIIAEEAAEKLNLGPDFDRVEAVNGYLNFYLKRSAIAASVLKEVNEKQLKFGHAPDNGKTMVIDYSSPNIGKELAFHHMRSTMIGNSLSRIYAAGGWKVVRINHLGDWGTQFGKLIVMYLREELPTDAETLAGLDIKDLNKLYASFSKAAKSEPELEDQARAAFAKLEQGDEFYRTLWTAFKDATLKELNRLYKEMGVEFDHYTGESFFNDKMDEIVSLLEDKQLLENSQERDVVMLEAENMPPCLIRKSDGSTLYATRDLAAALYRQREYNFDECLYVVDNGQALHFKQVFKVLEKMGFDWNQNMHHIPFGLILHRNEEGKWEKGKTRTGTASLLRDVFDAAQKKILDFIEEKNPELENKEDVAMKIGVSALTFNDLKNRRLMDIKFDWDQALSFEGATGPYVQNAHVRLCSIMRKAGTTISAEQVNFEQLQEDQAYGLILTLSRFSDRIAQALEAKEPYILAQFSLEVAEAAHRFIHHCRVLGSEEQNSRLFLVQCTQLVLENVLSLLGVAPLRAM
jgi:arginyl-tRNA synthetase